MIDAAALAQLTYDFYRWLFIESDLRTGHLNDVLAEYGESVHEFLAANDDIAIKDAKEAFEQLTDDRKISYLVEYRAHAFARIVELTVGSEHISNIILAHQEAVIRGLKSSNEAGH